MTAMPGPGEETDCQSTLSVRSQYTVNSRTDYFYVYSG